MPGTENGFMEVSMNTRRQQILTVVGITAFAVLIIVMFLFAIKQRDTYTSGDLGSIQHTTLGTIKKVDLENGIVAVRVHGEDEDYNYEYKTVLNYLEDEQVDLEFNHPDTD